MNPKKKILTLVGLFLLVTLFGGCLTQNDKKEKPPINETELSLQVNSGEKVVYEPSYSLEIVSNAKEVKINDKAVELEKGRKNVTMFLSPKENSFNIKAELNGKIAEKKLKVLYLKQTNDGNPLMDFDGVEYTDKGSIIFPADGTILTGKETKVIEGDQPKRALKRAESITSPASLTILNDGTLSQVIASCDAETGYNDGDRVRIYLFNNGIGIDYSSGVVTDSAIVVDSDKDGISDSSTTTGGIVFDSSYILNEGANELAIVVIHDSADSIYIGPNTVTVDTTPPDFTLAHPVNNNKLKFNDSTTTYRAINLEWSCSDSGTVEFFGALTDEGGNLTPGAITNEIRLDGVATTNTAITKDDNTEIMITTTGALDWYLYVKAVDTNGNATLVKKRIAGVDNSADLVTTQMKIKTDSNKVFRTYSENIVIEDSNVTFEYSSSEDVNATITMTYSTLNGQVVTNEEIELVNQGSGTYRGSYDFGISTDQKIVLIIEMEDAAGNTAEASIKLQYVNADSSSGGSSSGDYNLDESSFTFYSDSTTTSSIDLIPEDEDNKIYIDLLDVTSTTIQGIGISNPQQLDYRFKLNGVFIDATNTAKTYYQISTESAINISDDNQYETIEVYLGNTALDNDFSIIGVADFGSITDGIELESFKINQNQGTAEVSATVKMLANVKDEYKVLARYKGTSLGGMEIDFNEIYEDKLKYSGEISFYSDEEFDELEIYVYNNINYNNDTSTSISAVSFALDSSTGGALSPMNIEIDGIEDSANSWSTVNSSVDIDVTNSTSFSAIELYLDGNDEAITDLTDVDFENTDTITLIATVSGTSIDVKIEREIEINYIGGTSDAVEFITVPTGIVYYTSNRLSISGKVSTNTDTVSIISVTTGSGTDVTFVGGDTIDTDNPIEITQITADGSFSSPNLADDDLYTTNVTGAGIYTDFSSGYGFIEGEEYQIELRASNDTGAYSDANFTAIFDSLAPTEYYINYGSYKKFDDNDDMEWGIEKMYVDINGNLIIEESTILSTVPSTTQTAITMSALSVNQTERTIENSNGDIDFYINSTDSAIKYGYLSLIKNYKGNDDYLVGYIPISESDGEYTAIDSPEDIIVYIKDEDDSIIEQLTIESDDEDEEREIFVNMGDNSYEQIKISLKDGHENETATYVFDNSIYLEIETNNIEANISEGYNGSEYKNLSISSTQEISDMMVDIAKNEIPLLEIPNIDIAANSTFKVGLGGDISIGDPLDVTVTDKYGNYEFAGGSSSTVEVEVGDGFPPSIPTNIIVENNVGNEIITGVVEEGATVNLIDGNNTVIAATSTPAGSNGNFTIEFEINDVSFTGDLKLEVVDEAGNKSSELVYSPKYAIITDDFVLEFDANITGLSVPNTIQGIGDTITIDWNDIADGSLSNYKIEFYDGSTLLKSDDSVSASEYSILVGNLTSQTKNLRDIDVKVYGISDLDMSTSAATDDFSYDNSAPDISALTTTNIVASVSDSAITIPANALDTSGIVSTVDTTDAITIVANVDGTDYTKPYNASGVEFTSVGTIENDSTITIAIRDKAGNASSTVSIPPTDDKAPEINDLSVISKNKFNSNEDLQIALTHTSEDNLTVYGYDGNGIADGEPTGVPLGVETLTTQNTTYYLNITIDGVAEGDIYLFLKDSSGNYSEPYQLYQ